MYDLRLGQTHCLLTPVFFVNIFLNEGFELNMYISVYGVEYTMFTEAKMYYNNI